MIRAVIVDDEPLARDVLRIRLGQEPGIEIVGEAANAAEALAAVDRLQPDAVFLDIAMPGPNGLDVAARLEAPNGPAVVFVTAHGEHAIRAFEVQAIDYLQKPFTSARLRATLARLRTHLESRETAREHGRLRHLLKSFEQDDADPAPAPPPSDRAADGHWLPVREGSRYLMLDGREIFWVEAAGNYVLIHLRAGSHRIRSTLGDFAERLDPGAFVRIHRAAIVNRRHIREIRPTWHGDYLVTLTNQATVRLSRGFRSRLLGK